MKPVNIETRRAQRKKSAVISVGVFALIQIATAICMGALCFVPDIPGGFAILFAAMAVICLLLIIPAALLLKDRFKEIEGGELDAAAEY